MEKAWNGWYGDYDLYMLKPFKPIMLKFESPKIQRAANQHAFAALLIWKSLVIGVVGTLLLIFVDI